jgi:peroxiredoxin
MVRGRVAGILAVGSCLALLCCSPEAPNPRAGQAAPDFTLQALDGQRYRLEDLRGKVVFVNLWATWCPPCREEMPSMVRFYERFRARGVEILAVSEDTDGDALRKFVERYQVTFPVLRDENKRVYQLYRATGVPETHLINQRGAIVASTIGPFDWTSPGVVQKVEALLGR